MRQLSLKEHRQLVPLIGTLYYGVHDLDVLCWPKSQAVARYKKKAITAIDNLRWELGRRFEYWGHQDPYRWDKGLVLHPDHPQSGEFVRRLYEDVFLQQILPRIEGRVPMTILKAAARQLDCLAEAVSPQSIRSRTISSTE
jgi:hypothetical protein